MIPNWEYQTEKVALIPYDKHWPVFGDGVLGFLYACAKQDGILEDIFDPGMDFDKFVTYFSSKKLALQIYCLKEEDRLTPIGFCWVDDVVGVDRDRRALFGFCFFKPYRRRMEMADLGWLGIHYWFTALKIDHLFGITGGTNVPARNFARRYGFKELGTFDHFLYRRGSLTGATLVTLSAAVFETPFQEWRAGHPIDVEVLA